MIEVQSTPYGVSALAQLAAKVAEFKSDDPLCPVIIIVPNNVAGITARRHLAANGGNGRGIVGIEVTTLPRLAERLVAPTLTPRRPATPTVMAAAWRRSLSDDPGLFADVADHPATIAALTSTHYELRDLSTSALQKLALSTRLCKDVVSLHRRVTGALEPSWYDETTILAAARTWAAQHDLNASVILYLPQALTQFEAAFARTLGDGRPMTIIVGLTGVQRADEAVHRTLQRLGVAPPSEPVEIPTAHRIMNASDSDDEVRCVVREVVEALKSLPAHRIGILYAASSPYARLLHDHLAQAGITVNGAGVQPVNERAVARSILEVLALSEHDVPRADLFRALSNTSVDDFTGTRIPVSRWERVSRSAGVVRGEDWAGRLSAYIDTELLLAEREADPEREWLAERRRNNAGIARSLQEFVLTLRIQFGAAREMSSWNELSAWCLGLFTQLLGTTSELVRLPLEEQHAATKVRSALMAMESLDSIAGFASLDAARQVLELELASTPPRVGRFGDGVFVSPISSAVGLDLDVVFIVGLSEDVYPGRLREDALLPERARDSVPTELPSLRERLNRKQRDLYVAYACAGTTVASFPRGDLRRSSHRLPSQWLLPSLRKLSRNSELAATEWELAANLDDALVTSGSFAGELLETTRLATEQEWRTRQVSAGRIEDAVVAAAIEMRQARLTTSFTRFDGNLQGQDGLPNYADGTSLISPTALEDYATCPHAFFVNRLLRVEPIEQPEDIVQISPAETGNLIHESYDRLVKEFEGRLPGYGQPWSFDQRTRFVRIVDELARDFEDRGLTGHPTLWEGERRRITRDLIAMLDEDDTWRRSLDAAVTGSELEFGGQIEHAVMIPIPGGQVAMRGSVDKVDLGRDGRIHVTDIKTGSRRKFKDITQDDPLVDGTKLQLPVYAHAARKLGDASAPVFAQYWFVRRDKGRVGIELTPAVESLYAETLDTLVRSIACGMFPAIAPEVPDFAWVQCAYCNPDGIGHADQRERWERKRRDPVLHDLVALIEPAVLVDPEGA